MRNPIDLKGLTDKGQATPMMVLVGGDSVFVPRAEEFFLNGEVRVPKAYRLEAGTTVVQAISRGGGVTPRGS